MVWGGGASALVGGGAQDSWFWLGLAIRFIETPSRSLLPLSSDSLTSEGDSGVPRTCPSTDKLVTRTEQLLRAPNSARSDAAAL